MNQLFDINSVQVYGQITGPRQIVLLKLGIEGEEGESKTFVLTEWGAQAISNSLASAGISPNTGEAPDHDHEHGDHTHTHESEQELLLGV